MKLCIIKLIICGFMQFDYLELNFENTYMILTNWELVTTSLIIQNYMLSV